MGDTKIEWATKVWNPITGCEPVSEGCRNCYAKRMAKRLAGRCGYPKGDPFRPGTVHEDHMDDPLKWKNPERVFVCSMGDLFHSNAWFWQIRAVWNVMRQAKQHQFVVLTKRPQRMYSVAYDLAVWPPLRNAWLGVSVKDQTTADERIPILLRTPAARRVVSYEPALGPVDFNAVPMPDGDTLGSGLFNHGEGAGIDWLIAGGETGPGARPAHPDWFRSARNQCEAAGTPFFFKGWGEWLPSGQVGNGCHGEIPKGMRYHNFGDCISANVGKARSGRLLDGSEHNRTPEASA